MSGITNNVPASLVVPTTPMLLVPFVQMQQKQDLNNAEGNTNKAILDKDALKDDFKGLMPKWMLVMGNAYSTEEKSNSSGGDMGKLLANMSKIATLKEAFAKMISSLGSLPALLQFFKADAQRAAQGDSSAWTSQNNDIGAMANEIMNEGTGFSMPNGSSTQNIQTETANEYAILSQRAQSVGSGGTSTSTFIKDGNSFGRGLANDESTVADFLAKITQSTAVC